MLGSRTPWSRSDTPAVFALLVAFVVLFLLGFVGLAGPVGTLAWPVTVGWLNHVLPWQPLTFPFVHFDFMSLIVDGLILYFFGGSLERAWGPRRFLVFFFLSGIVAGVTVLALSFLSGGGALFAGMIGSFIAVVVAFAALNPFATVYLVVFPLQARWLALIVAAYDLFAGYGRYGGRLDAFVTIVVVAAFAWSFAVRRVGASTGSLRRFSIGDRIGHWRQRQRMRQWQRRVGRIDRPKDLFRD
ncbi:MAG: rhomboid family intramembrane serine protease [Candidatus Eremiobacteraeota bacterium]|nr:rhomboid family intramembrane serine protease [Candidatus Eremiobacteraeota bacterium]